MWHERADAPAFYGGYRVTKARNQWTITSRNPERKLIIGGRYILFDHVSLPPNYCDVKLNAKVPRTPETCQNLIKLSQ